MVSSPYLGFVLEVDGLAVALLEDAGVEVVLVLHAELPPAEVGVRHVVAGELGRLDVPHDGVAVLVLVADLHGGRGDAVDALRKR